MAGKVGVNRMWRVALAVLSCVAFLHLTPGVLGIAGAALSDDPFPLERLVPFGPDGTKTSNFGRIDSVALNQEVGHVYVLTAGEGAVGSLLKFGPEGKPVKFDGSGANIEGNQIKGLEPFKKTFVRGTQVAVDQLSGGFYVTEADRIRAFEADGEPGEFTAGPGAGTGEIPGFTDLVSIAVDANGSIYACDRSGTVSVFAPTGAPLTSFSVTNPFNLGVDSGGRVYVVEGQTTIRQFTPSAFPVTATTTYSGATFITTPIRIMAFDIDHGNGDMYVIESNFTKTWLRRYDGTGVLVESFGAPSSSTESLAFGGASEGIAVWRQARELVKDEEAVKVYVGDRDLVSSKVAGLGRKIPKEPPEVDLTLALDVTADSARLSARVDPNNLETNYRFEYGLEDCALGPCVGVPLGGASAGKGGEPVGVSQPIVGLLPNTTYHYRIHAENSLGSAVGPSLTFTTQSPSLGFQLVDSRVWEMVSPPDKRGAALKGTKGGLIRAASDGEGLAYLSLGTIEPDPEGNRAPEFSAVLAQRGPDGWHSQDISLANHEVIPVGSEMEGEFKYFSPDLSEAIIMPRGSTLLSPQASERTPYLWQLGDPVVYTPLLSGKEGFANVPPGIEFGGTPQDDSFGRVIPIGATPDLSHVVLRSSLEAPLVAGLPDVPGPPHQALYLWEAGELRPISVLPGGSMAPTPAFGSGETSLRHAISSDGSRVFWGRLDQVNGGALYMRDTLSEETVRLDVVQPGASGTGGASPFFQGASADGTVVLFRDSHRLTPDASPTGRDLYRCEIPSGNSAAGCASLTNLSAPLAGSGESAEVLGMIAGLSDDGTKAYFVARGVLDKVANKNGDSAQVGEPNLYLWQAGKGVRFVGTLAEDDKATWGLPASTTSPGIGSRLSAANSPSGRFLTFMSQRSLTGYVNASEGSGRLSQEVFVYDSVVEDLDCLSCDPSGAAPEAEEPIGRLLVNPRNQYAGLQVAAALPAASKNELGYSPYSARTALDNGRIFFNAFDSLVPADSNEEWDVYQWEPTGVGGCTVSAGDAATVSSASGCISLLSSGTAEEEAVFLDASVSGDDAFFLTPARLSAADEDDELDVYDARVDGVEATVPPQSDCQGEACRSAVVPLDDSIPGSAIYLGHGNAKPDKARRCPKGKRKVRSKGKIRCVPRKRAHRSNKASQNRGTVR